MDEQATFQMAMKWFSRFKITLIFFWGGMWFVVHSVLSHRLGVGHVYSCPTGASASPWMSTGHVWLLRLSLSVTLMSYVAPDPGVHYITSCVMETTFLQLDSTRIMRTGSQNTGKQTLPPAGSLLETQQSCSKDVFSSLEWLGKRFLFYPSKAQAPFRMLSFSHNQKSTRYQVHAKVFKI